MIKTNMCWTRVRHVLNIQWTHVEQMLKTCWKLFHIEQSVRSSDCAIVTRDKVNSRIESAVQECISFVAVKLRDNCFCFLINDNAWRYAPNSECLFLYRSNDLIWLSFHYLLIVYLIWRHDHKHEDQEWKNANTCEDVWHCHFWKIKQKAFKSYYSFSLLRSWNLKDIVQYHISKDHCCMFSEIGQNISKHFCCKSAMHSSSSLWFMYWFLLIFKFTSSFFDIFSVKK